MKWSTFWDNFIPRDGGPRDDGQTGKYRLRRAVSDLTLDKLMWPGDQIVEYTNVLRQLSSILAKSITDHKNDPGGHPAMINTWNPM